MNKSYKRFSLLNLSIEKRLPLYIFFLLVVVIVSLATVSYLGVRNSALELGRERVKTLTEQFTGIFNASTGRTIGSVLEFAKSEYLVDYLQRSSPLTDEILKDSLLAEFDRDTLTSDIELWTKDESLMLSTNESFYQYKILDSLFNTISSQQKVVIGKINEIRDTLYHPIIGGIFDEEDLIGYIVRWRIIKSNEQNIKQITGLLGVNASIYVGNIDGTLWTSLVDVVPAPSEEEISLGLNEYKNRSGDDVIAGANNIAGAPWMFVIEMPKKTMLEAADRFLQWVAIMGFIILLFGLLLSVIMSRNITTPLHNLTLATSDIADGNYSASVDLNRSDELGKLADSFNTMVSKVRSSKKDLENKVDERTEQLKSANTELENLNSRLRELDEIKTEFFTSISHELRTPLALILGPAEKLLSAKNLSPDQAKELSVIQQNARVLLRHVNNLLDLSKLEAGKMKLHYAEFDFADAVKIAGSYFESLSKDENIELLMEVPSNLRVQADLSKIERILMNLLSNAFKFTPRNGSIFCKVFKDNGSAVFEIRDSGPGIKPEFIEVLFERYSGGYGNMSRLIGSHGLGLSIVKEFLDLHKGSITAFNAEGGGAVFRFSIPVKAEIDAKNIENLESQPFGSRLDIELAKKDLGSELDGKKQIVPHKSGAPLILVVEDNIEMNRFITDILKDDYNIITAFDGEEGLEKAKAGLPDLILSDVMMPKMPGNILLEKLKADSVLSSIPIVFLTAKANEELKLELLKKGVYDYLNKPFSIEELKARINNILQIKMTRDKLQNDLKSYINDISVLAEDLIDKKKDVERSLHEKVVLLKEIHHRVKNNLQIISSLLNLQAAMIKDSDARASFVVSQNRIRSMALIHDQLYNSKDFINLDMNKYIHELVAHLFMLYDCDNRKIQSNIDVHRISINIDIAISVGLIINEAVTNSLKYAFNGEPGEISICFDKSDDENYILVIKDNGIGINGNIDVHNINTLGLKLVDTLAAQLHGELEIKNKNGTEIRVLFPPNKNPDFLN